MTTITPDWDELKPNVIDVHDLDFHRAASLIYSMDEADLVLLYFPTEGDCAILKGPGSSVEDCRLPKMSDEQIAALRVMHVAVRNNAQMHMLAAALRIIEHPKEVMDFDGIRANAPDAEKPDE